MPNAARFSDNVKNLKTSIDALVCTVSTITAYEKKVMQMAEALGVIALHFEDTKPGEKVVYFRANLTGKNVDQKKLFDATNEERIYRSWLEGK